MTKVGKKEVWRNKQRTRGSYRREEAEEGELIREEGRKVRIRREVMTK